MMMGRSHRADHARSRRADQAGQITPGRSHPADHARSHRACRSHALGRSRWADQATVTHVLCYLFYRMWVIASVCGHMSGAYNWFIKGSVCKNCLLHLKDPLESVEKGMNCLPAPGFCLLKIVHNNDEANHSFNQ